MVDVPFDLGLSRERRHAIFDLVRVNAVRADTFFDDDVRFDCSFLANGREAVIYCGPRNLTGRRNPTRIGWDHIGNMARIQEGISRFPLVGLEWSF